MPENKSKFIFLKNAREAKGLTLENVHEATKIPMDVLKAIEEGYTVKSVSPFYIKGFIKIYANFLDVNASEILETFPKQPVRNARPPVSEPSFSSPVTISLSRKQKQQLTLVIGVVFLVFVVVKIGGCIKTKIASMPKKEPAAAKPAKEAVKERSEKPKKKEEAVKPAVKEEPKEEKVKEAVKPAPKVEKFEKEPLVLPAAKEETKPAAKEESRVLQKVTLTARAQKDIWLLVKTDDQVVFQSTLSTGSVETWLADKKIEISGRNLNQLEFELNGKLIGPLGRQDRQAKRIEFTKDGLTVMK